MPNLFFLIPLINFVLVFIVTFVLLRYVFKIPTVNVWTLAGILIVGSLFLVFFGDPYRWLGIIIYIILVGFAFYKKFKLTTPQVIAVLVIILLVPFVTTYLTRGTIFKSSTQLEQKKNNTTNNVTDSWNLYTSSEDNFRVLFFGMPEVKKISSQIPDKKGRNFYLTSYASKLTEEPYYSIAVEEYSLRDINSTIAGFDAYMVLNDDLRARTAGGTIAYSAIQNIMFKNMPAIKYSYTSPYGSRKTEGLELVYKNKFYRLEVSNEIKDWPQTEVNKFFNSFELVK